CGILFHHCIERFLKAALLAHGHSLDSLRAHGHSLEKTWRAFKAEYPAASLDEFDATISRLNRFEDIRYPDAMIEQGMQVLLDWKPSISKATGSMKMPPKYHVIVNDLDRLTRRILETASRNPKALLGLPCNYADDALLYENPEAEFFKRA